MKLVISTAILCLLAAAPGYAQQEQDKEKEQQQEQKAQEEHRGQDKTQEKQPTEKGKQESAKQQEDARKAQDKQQKNETDKERQARDQNQKADDRQHSTSAQDSHHEADNHARRIPDDRYRANFGAQHRFHVEHRDDRRIQYGGYQFEYTAWPAGWGYNDDFFIEDIDGQYYLIDAVHPERRIVVVLIG
jgi:hypothetical protein